MSSTWTLLLTGPVGNLEDWSAAAAQAGWEVIPWPLLERVPGPDDATPRERPDWIAVTSAAAVEALEQAAQRDPDLRTLPLAVVGAGTAEDLYRRGWTPRVVPVPGASDARGLAAAMRRELPAGCRVFWPRGGKARELGELLRETGFAVEEAEVYDTRPVLHDGPAPRTDAVFFASPSAVPLWCREAQDWRPAALAIGWTTHDALLAHEQRFSLTLPLASPEPGSLRLALEALHASDDE